MYTRTCRAHSGGHELLPTGDPSRGGRPRSSGLYDPHFTRPQDAEFLALARTKVGQLDDELALLRRNLDDLLERAKDKPDLLAHVGDHVDRIARVEERRARTMATLQGLDSPPDPMRLVLDTGEAPDDLTDEARQRLRTKLLRDDD
jgi:hypothetical protein